jgi:N4-(beta-N-acetylglucosaminyl)-L-asparaginase
MKVSRRDFIAASAIGSASLALDLQGQSSSNTTPATASNPPKKPIIICAANGYDYLDRGYAVLTGGGDTLDAVMQVITGPENDPNDDSVGLGGLPDEDCVVQLDACCMHGPTRMAGAVAAVEEIKNVSLLSKAVMEHTGHVMLVGVGAQKFGFDMGFPRENLLTERSRKVWLLWKETMSNKDWWGPGLASPKYVLPDENSHSELMEERIQKMGELAAKLGIEPEFRTAAVQRVLRPPTGTINCSTINENGEISGATTTSGLAWKLSGRAGDSPIIGAGCYVDQDVGAAGATGNGEENIKVCGAHTIVENMRRGMSPQEAGMDALKRIVRNFNGDMRKMQYVDMSYYILRKDGAYAGVCMWSGPPDHLRRFAIHDGTKRYETAVALFQGKSIGWPPMPEREYLAPEQKK